MPGLDAENEVLIFRGTGMDAATRDRLLADLNMNREPCTDVQELPDDQNIVRIPLRFYPDEVPDFQEDDIILQTGDIVFVQSRNREVYYTAGALRGGAQQLPRDYDLDVLGAIALAQGNIGYGGVSVDSRVLAAAVAVAAAAAVRLSGLLRLAPSFSWKLPGTSANLDQG